MQASNNSVTNAVRMQIQNRVLKALWPPLAHAAPAGFRPGFRSGLCMMADWGSPLSLLRPRDEVFDTVYSRTVP